MIIKVDLTGDAALMAKLKDIPDKVERKIIVDSARKAWAPALKRARGIAPVELGALKRAIGIRMTKRKGQLTMRVSTRKDAAPIVTGTRTTTFQVNGRSVSVTRRVKRDPRKYFHLVTGGTKPHVIKIGNRTVHHPGTEAQPFMQRAFDAERSNAIGIFGTTFIPAIEREWLKGMRTA